VQDTKAFINKFNPERVKFRTSAPVEINQKDFLVTFRYREQVERRVTIDTGFGFGVKTEREFDGPVCEYRVHPVITEADNRDVSVYTKINLTRPIKVLSITLSYKGGMIAEYQSDFIIGKGEDFVFTEAVNRRLFINPPERISKLVERVRQYLAGKYLNDSR